MREGEVDVDLSNLFFKKKRKNEKKPDEENSRDIEKGGQCLFGGRKLNDV